jgi:hypothetical protein
LQAWQRHPSIFRLVVAVAAASLVVPAAANAWTWPVAGPVLRGFLFSEDNPLAPGQHRGIDIEGTLGDPVVAPAAGRVTFVGRVAANGLTVTIEAPDGYTVTLLHLGAPVVAEGALVAEGERVGTVGTSGVPEYSVPYVQLGIRVSADPEGYLDPQTFLPPIAAPPAAPAPAPAPALAPAPAPQPAPALPPADMTPPPAAAPQRVPADRAAPRGAAPVAAVPNRPIAQPEAPGAAARAADAPAALGAPTFAAAPHTASLSTSAASAARGLQPLDVGASHVPAASRAHAPRMEPSSPAIPTTEPAPTWVPPLDRVTPAATADQTSADHGSPLPSPELLALLAGLAAALCLSAREFGRRAARIIGGDALLPDNADLLRELEPAHRARVHDDRRGRSRPAPQAAR